MLDAAALVALVAEQNGGVQTGVYVFRVESQRVDCRYSATEQRATAARTTAMPARVCSLPCKDLRPIAQSLAANWRYVKGDG